VIADGRAEGEEHARLGRKEIAAAALYSGERIDLSGAPVGLLWR